MADKRPKKGSHNKDGTYDLIGGFKGYHAREDPTLISPNLLVPPSQNAVMNTAGRLAHVKGYVLDGPASAVADSGILSNYDFTNFKGDVRNTRAGSLTALGNDGKLQFRFVPSNSLTTVRWIDLRTGLTNVRLSFSDFWDTTELKKLMMWVDGSNFIYDWNGAVVTLSSIGANSSSIIGTVAAAPTAGGSGYAVGDILSVTTGGTGGQVKVATLSGSAIATITLWNPGTGGYTTGAGKATTAVTGIGTGATINIATVTTGASITKTGTTTWYQEGFFQTRSQQVVITHNGVQGTYSYTGGGDSTTLTGVTADPNGQGYAIGDSVHQVPEVTSLANMTAILATFGPTVIGTGRQNQLYVGASNSNSLYISKVNNYKDFSFSTPRIVGEGNLIPLDSPPTKFIPQEVSTESPNDSDMWISEGMDRWAVIRSTLSSDLAKETLQHIRLKVGPLQGALSERLATKMKNHILFVGNDQVVNLMGYFSFEYVPVINDISWPIIDDQNSYDLTDASVFYYKNFAYEAVPKAGLIRIYNMTDQSQETSSLRLPYEQVTQQPWFWESPVTYPISGFYVVNGDLYGHGYNTSESYQLFTGGSLAGQEITVNATFAYNSKGDRTQSKVSDEIFVEGYIKQNTILNVVVSGDLDAFETSQTVTIQGNDSTIVAFGSGGHALGKDHLGSRPLGGTFISDTLPAWFHVIKTYVAVANYLEKISFQTKGVDLQWELMVFGTNSEISVEGNSAITQ